MALIVSYGNHESSSDITCYTNIVHTQKIRLQTIYCSGYWILNWPPDGVNYEEVEDDEETERQEVDEDEEGGVVDVVQRLRPDSKHVNDGWRCFEDISQWEDAATTNYIFLIVIFANIPNISFEIVISFLSLNECMCLL